MKKYIVAICLLFCVTNLFSRYSETNRVDRSGDTMTGSLDINKNLTVDTSSLFVNSANHRVGIGTIAPSQKLSVYDGFLEVIDPDSSTSILFSAPADSVTSLLFRSAAVNKWSIVRKASTEDLCVYDYSTSTSCVMTFQQGGNIGVSTDTPSFKFDINGIMRSTGIVSTGDIDATGYKVLASSFALTGSGEQAVLSWQPTEYAVRVSTNLNIAGRQLSFGDGLRQVGCDGDDICVTNNNAGGNISFDVSSISSTVKIKDVLNLNPISAPPKDNLPEGSLYYDDEDNQVYYSTSSTNKTNGSGWQTLNIYNHIRGGISCSTNTDAITLTTQNKFYQITVFKDTSPYFGVTPSVVEDHIEIVTGGTYFVVCTLSVCATAKTQNYQMAIFKNNGQPLDGNLGIFLSQEINEIGTYHSVSMSGLVTFSAGDTIEVWIRNVDAGGESVTPRNGHLNIIKM